MIKINDPAELKYYTESQIYRDPTSNAIYLKDGITPVDKKASGVESMNKGIAQQENIMGRPLTQTEIARMYPDYAKSGGGFDRLRSTYNDVQTAKQGVNSLGNVRTGMNVLQEAIKLKNGTANMGIGESELFKLAGVGGMGALAQSLSARGSEIDYDYVQFNNMIGNVAGLYQDQMSQSLNAYKMAQDEYKVEADRLAKLDENLRQHKQQIDLIMLKSDIDKEMEVFKKKVETGQPTGKYFTDATGTSWNVEGWAIDEEHATALQGRANMIGKVDDSNIEEKVRQFTPGLTADMIKQTSEKYGVTWEALMAMVGVESTGGISPVAKKNNNFGGLTWSENTQWKALGGTKGSARPASEGGNYIKFPTKQAGLDAMGALMSQFGTVNISTPTNENISQVTGKPLTDTERTAKTYATRLQDSDKIISDLESKFTSIGSGIASALDKGLFGVSLFPEAFKSEDRKKIEQAERNFVNAVLRKESGAAISDTEFESAKKQYFPQAGDSAEVLKQKKLNRQTVIDGMMLSGGSYATSPDNPMTEEDAYQEYLNTINNK